MNYLMKNDLATVFSQDALILVRVTSEGRDNTYGLMGPLLNIDGTYYTAEIVEEIGGIKGPNDLRHNQLAKDWGYDTVSGVNNEVYRLMNHAYGG